jgi:hypothetical protein
MQMLKSYRMATNVMMILFLLGGSAVQAAQTIHLSSEKDQINVPIPHNLAWVTDFIAIDENAGSYASIAFDADNNNAPYISFYNAEDGSLWLTHYVGTLGGNCGPNNHWLCELIDDHPDDSGLYTSIDLFPDINPDPDWSTFKIGISYYNATEKALMVAIYKCNQYINCYWVRYMVDNSSDPDDSSGQYSSIKFDSNGTPHVVYFAVNMVSPMIFRSVKHTYYDESGGGEWIIETVDSSLTTIGQYPSLDIDWNDHLFISYYDGANDRLKFAYYAGDGLGICGTNDAWICEIIDDPVTGDVGAFSSLHAPQDPSDDLSVAYYDRYDGYLKYAYHIDDNYGNCGEPSYWQCRKIDYIGEDLTWAGISLAVDPNFKPVIAYSDASSDLGPLGLKVATPAGYGQPLHTCAGEVADWYCTYIDSGSGYVDDGKYASIAIKPDGLAMIAYSEQLLDYPFSYDLKLAYQVRQLYLPISMK